MSISNNSFALIIMALLIMLLCAFLFQAYKLTCKVPVMSLGENVTKVNDVMEIKKRMDHHGCLVCWKDSKGAWWFNRNDKPCRLR